MNNTKNLIEQVEWHFINEDYNTDEDAHKFIETDGIFERKITLSKKVIFIISLLFIIIFFSVGPLMLCIEVSDSTIFFAFFWFMGGVAAIVPKIIYYVFFLNKKVYLDKVNKILMYGSNRICFMSIAAIQLIEVISTRIDEDGDPEYKTYQINACLKNGERQFLMYHDKKDNVYKQANSIAEFIEVPFVFKSFEKRIEYCKKAVRHIKVIEEENH